MLLRIQRGMAAGAGYQDSLGFIAGNLLWSEGAMTDHDEINAELLHSCERLLSWCKHRNPVVAGQTLVYASDLDDARRVIAIAREQMKADSEPSGDSHPMGGMGYGIDYSHALSEARKLK